MEYKHQNELSFLNKQFYVQDATNIQATLYASFIESLLARIEYKNKL